MMLPIADLVSRFDELAYMFLFELKETYPDGWHWLFSDDKIIVADADGRMLAECTRRPDEPKVQFFARLALQLDPKKQPGERVTLPLA